ncbi:MAG: transposase, partial [Desulfobacterales bacterium]
MRHLNGVCSQRYNRRHQYDGQLFRGRYKSILMNAGGYLLQAVRYIHRNSLGGGFTGRIDDDRWSSPKGYLSLAR